jgi:glycosyltransferase involved in cell wall biosynthesis
MKRATIMCLPCVIGEDGNRDALPTVLLEALATGLPSISTPVTGIPEILADGAAGVIVPQRDHVATADAIASLLDDKERRVAIAEAGRRRAEELFDGRASARTLAAWFAEESDLEKCA